MSDVYPGFYDGEILPKQFPNWMAELDDETPISLLAIPGTHETCARSEAHGVRWKCQTLSMKQQLLGGIRYFDIRLVLENGVFWVRHRTVAQNITFFEVQNSVSDFLMKNPSEFLYMRVKHEAGTLEGFKRTFLDKVSSNLSLWFLENRIPRLKEVRGKIVLLQNFDGGDLGIPWDGANMKLQDKWKLISFFGAGILTKRWAIYNFSNRVQKMNDPNFLYLSHLSGSYGPLPSTVAKNTNSWFLSQHLEAKKPVGVIIADYPSSLLIQSIISANMVSNIQTQLNKTNISVVRERVIPGLVAIGTTGLLLYLGRQFLWRDIEPKKCERVESGTNWYKDFVP